MILAAARAEFAHYGLAGARIDRIARTAQASKERLYAHFGDKETLFREVLAADLFPPDDLPAGLLRSHRHLIALAVERDR